MSKDYSEIPLLPSTCLGLDMEEAIAKYPLFFTALATNVKESGGKVFIIAPRPPCEHCATIDELGRLGLPHDGVFFLPAWDVEDEEIGKECPHWDELGAYGSWFWLKAHIAEQVGVTHFIDEGAQLWSIFRRFLPNAIVDRPRGLSMRINPISGSCNHYSWHCGDSLPYKARYGSDPAASVPWQPTKAYSISFKGDIDAIYRAVARWNGVIYTYESYPSCAMLVVPAIVTLTDINKVLEDGGDGSFIECWGEEGAHP